LSPRTEASRYPLASCGFAANRGIVVGFEDLLSGDGLALAGGSPRRRAAGHRIPAVTSIKVSRGRITGRDCSKPTRAGAITKL